VKRVGESKKMGDKTQGGGVKKTLVKKTKNDWWEGERNEKRFKKRQNHVC
jgi:hypothetical protein